ncbi:MAG: hypothetical protein KGY80_03000 [Candidatus Thorarchaeota archaeon]|nr:hypothetical protein [Candidatus Thorarchaeota archaeon]
MEKRNTMRFVVLALVVVVAAVSVVILGGLASEMPDGFEWSLFEYAGVEEPHSVFEGIFAFFGEGAIFDVITGAIGIVAVFGLGFVFFRLLARRNEQA